MSIQWSQYRLLLRVQFCQAALSACGGLVQMVLFGSLRVRANFCMNSMHNGNCVEAETGTLVSLLATSLPLSQPTTSPGGRLSLFQFFPAAVV